MFFLKQRYVGKTDQKEEAYASGEKQGQQFIFEGKITFQNVETTSKNLWKCYSNDKKRTFFSQENLILGEGGENTLLFERKIVSLQSEIFVIIPTKIKSIYICKTL